MKMQNKNQSSCINYLKAFAIILVIIGHCLTYYDKSFGVEGVIFRTVVRFIYACHVPLFFIIAGYLSHKQNIKSYYLKKFKRLLIPFLTFSILKLFYSNVISDSFAHADSFSYQLFDAFIYGRLYWFVYCMLIIYLISPVLWINNVISYIAIPLLIGINIVNEKYNLWPVSDFTPFQLGRVSIYAVYFISGYSIRQLVNTNIIKKITLSFTNKLILTLFAFVFASVLFILDIHELLPNNYSCSLFLTYILVL